MLAALEFWVCKESALTMFVVLKAAAQRFRSHAVYAAVARVIRRPKTTNLRADFESDWTVNFFLVLRQRLARVQS